MELTAIPVNQIHLYEQIATNRLQVKLTMETHRLFAEFAEALRKQVLDKAVDDKLTSMAVFGLTKWVEVKWREVYLKWVALFEKARYEAVAISYGVMARMHYHYLNLPGIAITEAGDLPRQAEDQADLLLIAASQRIYGDGFKLSQRLWRWDSESSTQIKNILNTGVTSGTSAWDLAKRLEGYVGADADCPRWASSRLFKLTKKDIAGGDTTGLYSKGACDGQGVSYNALRLARTEIQAVHNMASLDVMKRSPWVKGVNIKLSREHPEKDICDTMAEGSPYPIDETPLPPYHPHCLCYPESALMDEGDFVKQLNGWIGGETWAEMGAYSTWNQAPQTSILGKLFLIGLGLATALLRWLSNDEDEMDKALAESVMVAAYA